MTKHPQIIIVGCGPGAAGYLTEAARQAASEAEVLVGAKHLLELFPLGEETRIAVGADMPAVLARIELERTRRVVVLVSGDSGLFSLARTVQDHFGHENCRVIPGISSVQLACARLGLDWHDLKVISAHGREPQLSSGELSLYRKIAILAGTASATRWAAQMLQQLGDCYRAVVCENLSWEQECIREFDAEGLKGAELASRTIILLIDESSTPAQKRVGAFYGVGVGPGDPELLTLKAARVLSQADYIYAPTSRLSSQDYLAETAQRYAKTGCEVRTVEFSLGKDARQRQSHWGETACEIAELLRSGQDVAFVTLGDSLLYSTYIYLIRALRSEFAAARIETVPGISAFSSAAAITSTPLGEGNSSLQVIPSSNDLTQIEKAVASGDAVVLMKIGKRLNVIIDLLEKAGALQRSVFVARAGLPEQRVETNLESLRGAEPSTGNLAVIIVPAVLIE